MRVDPKALLPDRAPECAICGAKNAPYGFRRAGPLSSLKGADRRRYSVCGDHIPQGEAWKVEADRAALSSGRQGDLFG